MHPSCSVSWKTGGMVHLQVDRLAKTQGQICPSGGPPLKKGVLSLCVHVGIGYSGLSRHRSEGISSFQLHIFLWYLQVFFVVCTVKTYPTVSQSVSQSAWGHWCNCPARVKNLYFLGLSWNTLLSERLAFRVEWRTFSEGRSTATVNAAGHDCHTAWGHKTWKLGFHSLLSLHILVYCLGLLSHRTQLQLSWTLSIIT